MGSGESLRLAQCGRGIGTLVADFGKTATNRQKDTRPIDAYGKFGKFTSLDWCFNGFLGGVDSFFCLVLVLP